MRAFALVAFALAGLAQAGSAAAQVPGRLPGTTCHDYKQLAAVLGKRYGEAPVSLGLQTNGHMLQVFTSPDNGTWTVLSVAPSGIGCIVAAGQHWQSKPAAGDPEA